MRILYIVNLGSFMNFFKYLIPKMISEGNQIDVICNNSVSKIDDLFIKSGCNVYDVEFNRQPLKSENFKAIKIIREIIKKGNYDIVHCHSGIQGVIGRIAAKKFKKNGLKIVYTPHGLNFNKGGSIYNWITYYPIERYFSRCTDLIVTMNKEEYSICKSFKKPKTIFCHGVGIDLDRFENNQFREDILKDELGIKRGDIALFSIGELTARKNHIEVIEALKIINNPNIKYYIAGKGILYDKLSNKIKEYNLENNVFLLGFRKDTQNLLKCMDVFVFPSLLEGLPVSVMEAMASGLPCIVSNISGNVDLIEDRLGGYVYKTKNVKSLVEKIKLFIENELYIRKSFSIYNKEKIKIYSDDNVYNEMLSAYKEILK